MPSQFRHNHYVPRWYQEKFLPAERKQRELFYLDKEPRAVRGEHGRGYHRGVHAQHLVRVVQVARGGGPSAPGLSCRLHRPSRPAAGPRHDRAGRPQSSCALAAPHPAF